MRMGIYKEERENYRPKMKQIDLDEVGNIEKHNSIEIEAKRYRPTGQRGLEEYGEKE